MSDPAKQSPPLPPGRPNLNRAVSIGLIAALFWISMGGCLFWMPVGCILSSRGGAATVVPMLTIVLLGGVIGAIVGFGNYRMQRDRIRRRTGLCVRCGYDVRFNFHRCPECGAPIPDRPPETPVN